MAAESRFHPFLQISQKRVNRKSRNPNNSPLCPSTPSLTSFSGEGRLPLLKGPLLVLIFSSFSLKGLSELGLLLLLFLLLPQTALRKLPLRAARMLNAAVITKLLKSTNKQNHFLGWVWTSDGARVGEETHSQRVPIPTPLHGAGGAGRAPWTPEPKVFLRAVAARHVAAVGEFSELSIFMCMYVFLWVNTRLKLLKSTKRGTLHLSPSGLPPHR